MEGGRRRRETKTISWEKKKMGFDHFEVFKKRKEKTFVWFFSAKKSPLRFCNPKVVETCILVAIYIIVVAPRLRNLFGREERGRFDCLAAVFCPNSPGGGGGLV